MTLRELQRCVRAELGQRHRYAHTLRVARLAASLARAHGADAGRALQAGLLHDVARLWPGEALLAECARRGLPVDDFERANPVVLHARVGAEIARERYGVRDEAVLEAIRAHTLGGPALSDVAKVVFLADALEPGRDYPARASLLRAARAGLDEGMRVVLGSTVEHLRERRLDVAPQTQSAIAYYDKERTLCRT